ncbi:hypothetical protein OAN10_03315 [Alphaproteobacteria bacterium]|jgi:hypothetical protein|nr:hypothetical protein [Alphaproteobacteria bacterium]|tara:strand:- start:217 stop:636 length:420 start_codon:yes stop_codon:yes gene_type:complete
MPTSIKFLIFATGWMVFRAVGSGLFLSLGILESPRAAPPDWTIAFLGDFAIGTTALFLAYMIWKKPSAFLWGILLAWNAVGLFDLIGALSHSFKAPFSPFPEIGINEISIRSILSLNTFIQSVALLVMFRPQVKTYFRV